MAALPADSDERQELAAGLGVLTLVETSLSGSVATDGDIQTTVNSLREVLNLRSYGRLRDLVTDALDDRSTLGLDLFAYAEDLRAVGHCAPAADVFTFIVEQPGCDPDLRTEATLRRGFALRLEGRLSDAEASYLEARSYAIETQNERARLEADLGVARIAVERGNLPLAETLVDSAIAECVALGQRSALGKAYIDRAAIAGERLQRHDVIRYSREALKFVATSAGRDRVLLNIATTARELERPDIAEPLALEVASETADASARVCAMLLLYHLATDRGDHHSCSAFRVAIPPACVSPSETAQYYEALGFDAAARRAWGEAEAALRRMLEITESNRLAKLTLQADAALQNVLTKRIPVINGFRSNHVDEGSGYELPTAEQILQTHPEPRSEMASVR